MRLFKILFLLIIVMFSSCRKDEIFEPVESDPQIPPPENVDQNLINGTVNDDTFMPIQGASVALYDDAVLVGETMTDNTGQFYFITEEVKDYLVYIESPGYQHVLTTVNPSESDNDVLVNLQFNNGLSYNWDINSYDWVSVSGNVINDDGSVAPNVTIVFLDVTGTFFNYITTDDSGYFRSTIPAGIPILIAIDQQCTIFSFNDFITATEDINIGDVVVENSFGSTSLQGIANDCDGNPIETGEIHFYQYFDALGGSTGQEIVSHAEINDGVFFVEFDEVCDPIIYYEAIDFYTGIVIYDEIDISNDSTVIEEIVVCQPDFEDGTISLSINNSSYTLDDHFALEYKNRVVIYSQQEDDFVFAEFDIQMSPGTYDVDQLQIIINDEEYYSYGLDLQVVISNYPLDQQDTLRGTIEGDIYNDLLTKIPFSLSFDLPIY